MRIPFTLNRPYGSLITLLSLACALIAIILFVGAFVPSLARLSQPLGMSSILAGLIILLVVQSRHRGLLNDLHAAVALEGALSRSGADLHDFFYDGAAATSGLELLHLKVLLLTRPRSILELGSGQSTKLISHYQQQNPDVIAITLEQSDQWWSFLKKEIRHDYRLSPITPLTLSHVNAGRVIDTKWYDLPADVRQQRFEYILVDGPDHGKRGDAYVPFARSGVLQFLPELLAQSFVVVFDDAERRGETETINAFNELLRLNAISYTRFSVRGVKTQEVFCSPERAFLRSV